MYFPKLSPLKQKMLTISAFGGYNRNHRIADGEFFDMENLTSDGYPVLMPRQGRSLYATCACGGMLDKDCLCYVSGQDLVINGFPVELDLSPGEKQLVSMGAYVVIFPDKKYVNTLDHSDRGSLEARFVTTGPVGICLCLSDGTILTEIARGERPEEPSDRQYWLDGEEKKLQQYSAQTDAWTPVENTCLRLSSPGIGAAFSVGDGVILSGVTVEELNTAAVIRAKGENFVVIPGFLPEDVTQEPSQGAITLERPVPEMDFVIQADNRLWGCRYGPDRAGNVVNELYACKLGDFKNWYCYQGISTDSYCVSLGADGPFTGAVTYLGFPLFFRENCLHKVYGSYPADYRIQTTACRGVQKECHKSLAIVDEVLYYRSPEGICGYDGSLPVCVSGALGKTRYFRAVGAGHNSKYYVSMEEEAGDSHLFVYDTRRKLWHREDSLKAKMLCSSGGDLYAGVEGEILCLTGPSQETVHWSAQTGPLSPADPHKRYISRITPRLYLEPGARVSVCVRYDGIGGWEPLATVSGKGLRSFSLPMNTRRCDYLELRLQGVGQGRLYSLTLTTEQGGDGL